MSYIHPDLEWIAKDTDKWGGTPLWTPVFVNKETGEADYCGPIYYNIDNGETSTHPQYLHARHVLGLDDETKGESNMHPDLEWLARNVSEWDSEPVNGLNVFTHARVYESPTGQVIPVFGLCNTGHAWFSKSQWLQARQDLGLVMTEEEEAMPAEEHRNKYMREIKPGVWVDVYDVLAAWDVRNPALQHLIKKALAPGQRGHKTLEQDMDDIVASAERARELEK